MKSNPRPKERRRRPSGGKRPDETASPFKPSEAWLASFELGYTDEMLDRARLYAERRARWVGRAGYPSDAYYSRELVMSAVSDTLLGVVAWDPNAKSLQDHVLDTIQARTHHDRRHAERYPRYSIDELTTDNDAAAVGDVDAKLVVQSPVTLSDTLARATEAIAELRQLAVDDPDVLAILDAFAAGLIDRAEVIQCTGLARDVYKNARRRLRRLASQLSTESSTETEGTP